MLDLLLADESEPALARLPARRRSTSTSRACRATPGRDADEGAGDRRTPARRAPRRPIWRRCAPRAPTAGPSGSTCCWPRPRRAAGALRHAHATTTCTPRRLPRRWRVDALPTSRTHTTYAYDERVSVSHHVAHLMPRDVGASRRAWQSAGRSTRRPPACRAHRDYFGNRVAFFDAAGAARRADSSPRAPWSTGRAATAAAGHVAGLGDRCATAARDAPGVDVAWTFVFDSPLVAGGAGARAPTPPSRSRRAGRSLAGARRPHAPHPPRLPLRPRAPPPSPRRSPTSSATAPASARTSRTCRSAACARSASPARYVSGYLETSPPPGEPRARRRRRLARLGLACSSPASAGSTSIRPTTWSPADRHVTLAWGRDYADVSPIRGVILGGGEQRARVAVDLVRRG